MDGRGDVNVAGWADVRKHFLWGATGAVGMVLFTFAVRSVVRALSMLELAADWFTMHLPPELFDLLLENLLFNAKPLMFAGLVAAQVIAGGALAALYGRHVAWRASSELWVWMYAAGFGLALWLAAQVALTPLFGGGLFGVDVPGGAVGFQVTSVGSALVYALVIGFFFSGETQGAVAEVSTGTSDRRAFLKKAGVWAAVIAGVAIGLKLASDRLGGQVGTSGSFRTQGVLSTEVTPNDEFYIVSKNFIDPTVKEQGWILEIDGLVEVPYWVDYQQLITLPSVEEYVTLECISNLVGGDLISNAKWRGVPLRAFLERARLRPGVVDIAFYAQDGYSESIPLEMAMRDEVMVAYEMNGEPLPSKHGFPARLIVPGFFGLKHVKWLTKIEPVVHDFRGYWQQRGWTDVPWVKTFSRIDVPSHESVVEGGMVSLGGVAFAGDRGISNVEVSLDDGATWTAAGSISEPLSPYTWVIWRAELPAPGAEFGVRVRATDGEGAVQTAEVAKSLPSGATGHHAIRVRAGSG